MNGLILFRVLFHQQAVSVDSVRGYVSLDEATLVGADVDNAAKAAVQHHSKIFMVWLRSRIGR